MRPHWIAVLLMMAAAPSWAVTVMPGDLLVTDQTRRALFRVDPVSGDRTVISGCADANCTSIIGSGTNLGAPSGMAIDPGDGEGAYLYVTDTLSRSLLRIDPATGDRVVVSSSFAGSGPTFSSPLSISIHGTGNLFVLDETLSAVLRVDPTSGDRNVVSGCVDASCSDTAGGGDPFLGPHDLFLDASGDMFVLDDTRDAIFRVDAQSGDRTWLSSPSLGSGPAFVTPRNLTLDASGAILLSDSGAAGSPGMIFAIDPNTGDRVLVASDTIGAGRNLEVPVGLAVDAAGNILVLDFAPGIILSIDPVTGDRTIVSSSQTGVGTTMSGPVSIAIVPDGTTFASLAVPEPGTLPLLAAGLAALGGRRRRRRRVG